MYFYTFLLFFFRLILTNQDKYSKNHIFFRKFRIFSEKKKKKKNQNKKRKLQQAS